LLLFKSFFLRSQSLGGCVCPFCLRTSPPSAVGSFFSRLESFCHFHRLRLGINVFSSFSSFFLFLSVSSFFVGDLPCSPTGTVMTFCSSKTLFATKACTLPSCCFPSIPHTSNAAAFLLSLPLLKFRSRPPPCPGSFFPLSPSAQTCHLLFFKNKIAASGTASPPFSLDAFPQKNNVRFLLIPPFRGRAALPLWFADHKSLAGFQPLTLYSFFVSSRRFFPFERSG